MKGNDGCRRRRGGERYDAQNIIAGTEKVVKGKGHTGVFERELRRRQVIEGCEVGDEESEILRGGGEKKM